MNKGFLTLSVAGTLLCSMPQMQVKAYEKQNVTDTEQSVLTENQERTAGLIKSAYLSITSSSKSVCLTGSTKSNLKMKSIGYKDIIIEYSSDKTNWYTEKNIGDLLKSDCTSYNLNSYSVSVKGGYYYRVTCTHYAKESGLTGSSQSVGNTSNSVWVS